MQGLGESAALLTDPTAELSESRFQLFDRVIEALDAAAAAAGLLIVIDDLHWADVPSMRLLHYVAAAVPDSRILLLALYRSREAARYAEWAEVMRAIRRERAARQLTLPGLAAP